MGQNAKRKNEIIEEVRRNREEFAREHDYDLDAMVTALQEMEKHPLTKVVDRRRKKPEKTTKKRKQ
jgi:hypothetical protein